MFMPQPYLHLPYWAFFLFFFSFFHLDLCLEGRTARGINTPQQMASTHTAMILAAFSADDAQHTGVDKELQAFTMLLLMLESEDAYMETVTIESIVK